jgi:hypothetical protein
MRKLLLATISVLLCSSANAGSLCPYDTPACRMMPDRYIAPQMGPYQPTYSNPPVLQYRQMLPNGDYGRRPQLNPDGSYPRDDD